MIDRYMLGLTFSMVWATRSLQGRARCHPFNLWAYSASATSSQVLPRLEFWASFFLNFFRKEPPKNVFDVETSFFTYREGYSTMSFSEGSSNFRNDIRVQTSWATSGSLSCLFWCFPAVVDRSVLRINVSYHSRFGHSTYMECSHGDHFSEVSKFFKLDSILNR